MLLQGASAFSGAGDTSGSVPSELNSLFFLSLYYSLMAAYRMSRLSTYGMSTIVKNISFLTITVLRNRPRRACGYLIEDGTR